MKVRAVWTDAAWLSIGRRIACSSAEARFGHAGAWERRAMRASTAPSWGSTFPDERVRTRTACRVATALPGEIPSLTAIVADLPNPTLSTCTSPCCGT